MSVLKNVKEIYKAEIEGGYTAGESLASYYNIPNIGFYGFYANNISYSNFEGVYVEETITVRTAKNYVLETLVYNLDLEEKKQLVATITSEIEEPESIPEKAKEYAKTIYKGLKK